MTLLYREVSTSTSREDFGQVMVRASAVVLTPGEPARLRKRTLDTGLLLLGIQDEGHSAGSGSCGQVGGIAGVDLNGDNGVAGDVVLGD